MVIKYFALLSRLCNIDKILGELNKKIDELQKENEQIMAAIDDLNTNVSNLGTSVNNLIAAIPDPTAQNTAIESAANAVKAIQATVDAKTAELNPPVTQPTA